MCDIALAGLALSAIGTMTGMFAQREQAKAQAEAAQASADYNAQVAANEAETQRQLAQNEINKGIADRERAIRAGVQKQGELRSLMASSGFEIDSGSNVSLLAQSAEEAQYDANIISGNAAQAAWQHQANQVGAQNQGDFSLWQGKQAANDSGNGLGMAGSLIGGIGSGLGMYAQIKNTATPGTGKTAGKPSAGKTYSAPASNILAGVNKFARY